MTAAVASSAAAQVVMTVHGPQPPEELAARGGSALCREWLLSDQANLLERTSAGVAPPSRPRPEDVVELGNLAAMRRWPLASLHNLHLSREDALRELTGPFKHRHGGSIVVVSTPRAFWSPEAPADRGKAMQALSSEAGVALVVGTAPAPGKPASEAEIEAEVAGLISDLVVGFAASRAAPAEGEGERPRPGFLGELQLWESGKPAPVAEVLALRACVEAQRRTGAPMLLSGPVSEEAFAILEAGPCLWEKCCFFDVPPNSPKQPAQLAEKGSFLGFCPPAGAADVSWEAYSGRRPWRSEEVFLEALTSALPGRSIVGSGLRFRTDLAAYGGAGLSLAPELLAFCAAAGATGSPAIRPPPDEAALRNSVVRWLQYPWRPPAAPEQVVHTIMCHWCGTRKKDGEHFSKMAFNYCAPKCIRKHGQVEYAPDKHERC